MFYISNKSVLYNTIGIVLYNNNRFILILYNHWLNRKNSIFSK